jgi:hypothetical protein
MSADGSVPAASQKSETSGLFAGHKRAGEKRRKDIKNWEE